MQRSFDPLAFEFFFFQFLSNFYFHIANIFRAVHFYFFCAFVLFFHFRIRIRLAIWMCGVLHIVRAHALSIRDCVFYLLQCVYFRVFAYIIRACIRIDEAQWAQLQVCACVRVSAYMQYLWYADLIIRSPFALPFASFSVCVSCFASCVCVFLCEAYVLSYLMMIIR